MKSGLLYILIKTLKLELKVSNDAMGITFKVTGLNSRDIASITLKRRTVVEIYNFLDKLRIQLDIPNSDK